MKHEILYISLLIILSSTAAADSSHSADEVTEGVSCNSSVASVSNHKPPPPANFRYEFRRLATRSNYRNEISKFDEPLEVESCSGANDVRELFKLKSANVEESEAEGGGGEVSKSEVSSASPRLACSEKFSNGAIIGERDEEEAEEEQNSSSPGSFVEALSDLAYTESIWPYTSGSQFSDADEKCSPCFQFFSQFKQRLCRSTFSLAACADDCSSPEFTLSGLVDEEDEESYRMLMKRERRQVYLRDYAEEYCNTTDYGHLVIQQRLHMVHWIVEQATTNKLRMETMFLGVSFLDRFLAKGYFKNMRDLQIDGEEGGDVPPGGNDGEGNDGGGNDGEGNDGGGNDGGGNDGEGGDVPLGGNDGEDDEEGVERDEEELYDELDEKLNYVCHHCASSGAVSVLAKPYEAGFDKKENLYFMSISNVDFGVSRKNYQQVCSQAIICRGCKTTIGSHIHHVGYDVEDIEGVGDGEDGGDVADFENIEGRNYVDQEHVLRYTDGQFLDPYTLQPYIFPGRDGPAGGI